MVAVFREMLERDRIRNGLRIGHGRVALECQAAGVSRELEAGTRSPDFETWDRICKPYGWPQTFFR
jgi:hypothetical protein